MKLWEINFILVQRGISAYKVGCEKALDPFPEDINDGTMGNFDFSNDVIARAKYFEENLF